MLFLAMAADDGPVTSHEIATQQGIPEPYLRQILAALSREGLIDSNRGPQGGHSLGRDADAISLRDIVVTLEGQITSIDHVLEMNCTIGLGPDHCAIREVFLEVKEAVERILGGTSLADLAGRQQHILDRGLSIPLDIGHPALPIVTE